MAAVSRRSLARAPHPKVYLDTVPVDPENPDGPKCRTLVTAWRARQLESAYPGERRDRRFRRSKAFRVLERAQERQKAMFRKLAGQARIADLKRKGLPLPGQPPLQVELVGDELPPMLASDGPVVVGDAGGTGHAAALSAGMRRMTLPLLG
jgi:hypothetical protein